MSAPVVTVRPPTGLALLLGVAALLLIGSGVSYTLVQARPGASAHAVPVDALYNLALDASAAMAGDAAALTRFQQRQKALEEAKAYGLSAFERAMRGFIQHFQPGQTALFSDR